MKKNQVIEKNNKKKNYIQGWRKKYERKLGLGVIQKKKKKHEINLGLGEVEKSRTKI